MRATRSFVFTATLACAGATMFAWQGPTPPPAGAGGAGAPAVQGGRGPGGPGGPGGRGGRGRAGVPIQPGEQCPPGMTETRARFCSTPEFAPPSIVDYRPRTTLVAEEHLVPRAKFPVIDIHNHTTINAQNIDQMIKEMDTLNLRVLVNLSGGAGPDQVKQKVDFLRGGKYADRFRVFANVQWDGAGGPGWAEKAVADLEQAVKNGAIGLKIAKNLGLTSTKADGTRLKVDDPALKPIWDLCARLNIPVIIHTAEPREFFSPLDFQNERWLELSLFGDRRNYEPGKPTFEELMGERDRMYAANPKTRYIGAHFNWYGSDLARAGKQLDAQPNLVLEVGAVLYDFGRQPRASREFFTKYQDRVLFGKDAYEATEFPYYWRVFETNDEYFDYYRDYHAFWKLYGMGLPDVVLRKLYYQNALRVTPGLPQTGWPR
jgi:predicted TIM-barrel fold metal-dependent hydrolase